MASIVEKDAVVALHEEQKRSAKESYEKKKKAYREKLKNSESFQEYVVKDVLKDMNDLADIRNMPVTTVKDMDGLTFNIRAALNIVENFIGPFRIKE